MEVFAEWTFEGAFELIVGSTGNRTRYQSDMYDSTWMSGRFVKVSGTAEIVLFPSQA